MVVRTLVSAFALFAMSNAAMAGDFSHVSFETIKDKCAGYIAHGQMRPVSATVYCSELSYEWRLGKPTTSTLPNQRNVGASVVVKTDQVPNQFFPFDTANTEVQCVNLIKVEKKVDNIAVEISCSDLVNINDLGAFCRPVIEQRVSEDPELVVERPTAETMSLCPAAAHH